MTHLLPTPLVLDRGGAVARQRSLSKTWLLSTDFSWSALSTSCRFAVERPAYKRADNGSDLFSPPWKENLRLRAADSGDNGGGMRRMAFEITAEHISRLDAVQFTALLRRLLHLEPG